jgi:hypothetical protein
VKRGKVDGAKKNFLYSYFFFDQRRFWSKLDEMDKKNFSSDLVRFLVKLPWIDHPFLKGKKEEGKGLTRLQSLLFISIVIET